MINFIDEILAETNLNIDQIEKIGIAAPGTTKGRYNSKSRKSRNKKFCNNRYIKEAL